MLTTHCGTPSYMAPEVCQKREHYAQAADIWSFGIIIFVLLTGKLPFRGVNEKDLYSKISRCLYHIPETVEPGGKALINNILKLDATKRLTAYEICNDTWINTTDNNRKVSWLAR